MSTSFIVKAAKAVAEAEEAAREALFAQEEVDSKKKPPLMSEVDVDALAMVNLDDAIHDEETFQLQQELRRQREDHAKQVAEAVALRMKLEGFKAKYDAAVQEKHDMMHQADQTWDKYKVLKKMHRSKILSTARFNRTSGNEAEDKREKKKEKKKEQRKSRKALESSASEDESVTKEEVVKSPNSGKKVKSNRFHSLVKQTMDKNRKDKYAALSSEFERRQASQDGNNDSSTPVMATVDLDALMKRLDDLETSGVTRKTQMDNLDNALREVSESAAQVVGHGSGRDSKLRDLNSKLKSVLPLSCSVCVCLCCCFFFLLF